jgi:adenine-specific DNA-methyltransferase
MNRAKVRRTVEVFGSDRRARLRSQRLSDHDAAVEPLETSAGVPRVVEVGLEAIDRVAAKVTEDEAVESGGGYVRSSVREVGREMAPVQARGEVRRCQSQSVPSPSIPAVATDLQLTPSQGVTHGEVFTRRWVVDVLLDLAGYSTDKPLNEQRLVDPSCGSGAFLVAAAERLLASLDGAGHRPEQLVDAITAWDVQAGNVEHCRTAVRELLRQHGYRLDDAELLAARWVRQGDYLLQPDEAATADVVVGNPPYVRLEDVPAELQRQYRARWTTMGGRADLYVGFIERALRSLAPGGRLAFICADRWMRNQYGADLRALVAEQYSVEAVWTMHDVDAFESMVSAYPAITVISRRPQHSAVVAETTEAFGEVGATQLARWTRGSELSSTSGPGYQAYRLPHWFPGDELWPSGSPERLALIEHLNDHFGPLHDPARGTRVGIGVATGADKVFLTTDTSVVEPDRLLPMATVQNTRSGRLAWDGVYLVNPWTPDGSPVDLARYPKLASYLSTHHDQLSRRYIARGGKRWYQTIDKVNHALTAKPKLLIQDMRTAISPALDPGGYYPHHNLYYVTSEQWDMEVLGGLLLSRVAQAFIEAYCVRMRGNTLRFQAQYLKKIRVPRPEDVSADVQEALRAAFHRRDVAAATNAALDAYKLDHDTLGQGGIDG